MKSQILNTLSQSWIPDFSLFLSSESEKEVLALLFELLEQEKNNFHALLVKLKEKESREALLNLPNAQLFEILELNINENQLSTLWNLVNHLYSVGLAPNFREIIEQFQEEYLAFADEISYSQDYYLINRDAAQKEGRTSEEIRIFTLRLEDFEHRGINQPEAIQSQIKTINQRIAKLSDQIQNNVVDDQQNFSYKTDNLEAFSHMPALSLEKIKNTSKESWKLTIDADPNILIDILRYCDDSQIRQDIYWIREERASKAPYNNKPLILELLKLKEEKAQLLWYRNFADYQLKLRMAGNPENAKNMIHQIFEKALPKAEKEIETLKTHYQLNKLEPRDLAYYTRKYKEEVFAIQEEKLKEYFEFDQVLNWLHSFVGKFFGIEIKKTWETKDNLYYEVFKDWNLISYFFLDAFYRPGKRPGAWADILRAKNANQLPIVLNVCNFQKSESWTTLLKLSDVETLFHEFGHALHAMLAESKYPELNGFNVEWDFVELPSQLLERWAGEPEALKQLSKHYQTWETLPDETVKNIKKLSTFMMGNWVVRQNELAIVDLMLYSDKVPENIEALDQKILEIVNQYSLFKRDERYQMYCCFLHIFGGGYAAGYYSYMRAEALEADVFSKIRKKGLFNPEIWHQYRDQILAQGTKKPAIELFEDFMGRELDPQALIEKYDL